MQDRGVAVVIPTLNEEDRVADAIASAWKAGARDVVVVDGGSRDRTVDVAASHARVLTTTGPRGRQLNLGIDATQEHAVIVLHADSELPESATRDVMRAIEQGHEFGGFRLSFRETDLRLRFAERLINARTRWTRCPWGDQGQFLSRALIDRGTRYREMPLMEDYELAVRLRDKARACLLPAFVRTSGRRFLERGLIRTMATNWRIVLAYRLGADPQELASWYRG